MDTNRLKYFCAVAESGSVRGAAELLHVSPPALSKAIHILEEELGIKLFVRSGRSILLTDAGFRLAEKSRAILKEIDNLKISADEERSAVQELKIATFEVFSTYFLKALDLTGWGENPLTIHDVLPGELERALVERHVDVGITYMPVPVPELDFLKITSIEMGVYTAKGVFPNIPQPELPFVVPVSPIYGAPSRVRGLDGWPEDAYPRNVRYQVTLLESALELCRGGKAAGYFPSFVVNAHNKQVKEAYQLTRRTSPYCGRTCKTDVFLVKRKTDHESKTMKQLAKAIRLMCKPS